MKMRYLLLMVFSLIVVLVFLMQPIVHAQDWAIMPPYNLLWPLWSPVYSPPDPITGIPTPLLNQVTGNTILPIQPIYLFNPNGYEFPMGYIQPWLLYNSPGGAVYFDVVYGLNPFPPPELIDSITGLPIPIPLPLNWSTLAIPPLSLALYLFELGNLSYMIGYGNDLGVNPLSLLTYYDVYGVPGVLTPISW